MMGEKCGGGFYTERMKVEVEDPKSRCLLQSGDEWWLCPGQVENLLQQEIARDCLHHRPKKTPTHK